MAVDPKEGLVEFRDFKGLRNTVDISSFGRGDLTTALNVDIDDEENINRRKGFSTVMTSAVDRALFAAGPLCLGVGSNALKQVLPDWSTITLRSGLTANRDLSYTPVGARVYYSNGVELGVVENGQHRSWGLPVPALLQAATTGGDLQPGIYQFTVTFIRQDGQESGAARAGTIALTATGGISLSAIPVASDATIVAKAVYVSTRDGSTLYRAGLIANATTTFAIREEGDPAAPLQTQFLSAPPAGDFLAFSRGHMLVAAGNKLYPSEPYAPELFDLRKRVTFLDRITMIAPIADGKVYKQHGIWIGTDSQIIWLQGDSPDKWDFQVKAGYGVIPGTLDIADGELIGDGTARGSPAAFFASKRGLCFGKQGGEFHNATEARFAYPSMDKGAGVVRRHIGTGQYVVTLQGTEVAGNAFA